MGEYVLSSPMLSIPMGGVDFALGVQWLQYLATIAFNFQERYLIFFFERKGIRITGYHREARKYNKLKCHDKACK